MTTERTGQSSYVEIKEGVQEVPDIEIRRGIEVRRHIEIRMDIEGRRDSQHTRLDLSHCGASMSLSFHCTSVNGQS